MGSAESSAASEAGIEAGWVIFGVFRRRMTVPLKSWLTGPVYEKTIEAPPSETYFQSAGEVIVASKDIVVKS